MKKVIFITGVETSKGIGKTSGRPYEFGHVLNLTPVRNWQNDNGKSSNKGFTVDPEKCAKCNLDALSDFNKIGNENFPAWVEVDIDIDPEDMSSTIIVSAVLVQHFDIFNPPSPTVTSPSSSRMIEKPNA